MAARKVIVASVRDFLEEIDKLKLEKDGLEAGNPTMATYLQCEIFRKFAIIDSLINSCPQAKEIVEEEVFLKKRLVTAEAEDVKRMHVPKKLSDGRVEEPFPYLALPPEVRQVILGFMTSLSDQLNWVEVLPDDAQMMGWNNDVLQFEMVLSLLMSRKMVGYDHLLILSQAGGYVQEAVSKWFEAHLRDTFTDIQPNRWRDWNLPGVKNLKELTPDERALHPIPARIRLSYHSLDHHLENLQTLREMGHNILDCIIKAFWIPLEDYMDLVRDCLQLMPNVKFLELEVSDCKRNRKDGRVGDELELPVLPKLQALKLSMHGCDSFALKILRKYQSGLSRLRTCHFPLGAENDDIPYRRLSILHVAKGDYYCRSGLPVTMERLGDFFDVGTPLKRLRLDMGYGSENTPYLRNIMTCLNKFRDTLEELDVTFADACVSIGWVGELSWLAKLEFPKVKTLTVRGNPGAWTILLHFPNLETLTWHCSPERWKSYFFPSRILNLSWNKREMFTSNVWKMLLFLTTIESFGGRRFRVTRSECLDFQVKQGLGKRKCKSKEERRQENPDWGTRKSGRIASMEEKKKKKH